VLTNIHPGTQHIYTPEANFKTSSTQAVHLPEKFEVIVYLTVCIAFVHRAVQHIPCWISKVIATGNSHLRMMINTSPYKARMVPELMRNGWNFVKLCGCLNKIVHL
jgi:hypothetical protein